MGNITPMRVQKVLTLLETLSPLQLRKVASQKIVNVVDKTYSLFSARPGIIKSLIVTAIKDRIVGYQII